ncbi:MAG: DUF2132 domain-containing protein [Oceanospirillaceae bacterium]|jgi:uncharacterized protein (DUF2132 family)|nr:DUF2132 domain-containing protein [Oceanospirillaceae bacterium]MBT5629794.1 DUF2132 domain-containing protein [Oceanospirillaceae bacterium]MBT6100248.1 DUF2132 domain-containing protein [Oceanospirillaceae bacterium]
MSTEQPHNPLHGVKLEQIVTDLVDTFGWDVLAEQVNLNCFRANPSVRSSLKFLRKTQWARDKVESLYVYAIVRGKPLKPQHEYQAQTRPSASTTPTTQALKKPKSAATNSHIWKTSS